MRKPIYVYVTPYFPSPGNWRFAHGYDFVMALISTGLFDVRVFVEGNGCAYEYRGVRVCQFRSCRLPSNVFPFLFEKWNAASFLKVLQNEGIRVEDVAVCHAHTANFVSYPLAVKKLNKNCLALLHHHCPQSFGLNLGRLRHLWLYNLIEYPLLRRRHEEIDCHLFISNIVAKSFLSVPDTSWTDYPDYRSQMKWLPYASPRIRDYLVVHNVVDEKSLCPIVCGKAARSKTFVIGCIGNFVDWKDQQSLIKAIRFVRKDNNPEIKIRFVGTGPTLKECRGLAKSEHVDAEFTPKLERNEIADFYHSLDLFVLPSYFEGFGCVFIEAALSGVPFITCEGQGMDDYFSQKERGKWLVRRGDVRHLGELISNYIAYGYKQEFACPLKSDEIMSCFVAQIQRRILEKYKS